MNSKVVLAKIEAKGLTKSHVSKMVGIDQATLSRVLSGKQPASEDLAKRINNYLDAVNSDDPKINQNNISN